MTRVSRTQQRALGAGAVAILLLVGGSCAQQARVTTKPEAPPASPAPTASPDLGKAEHQYLVHDDSKIWIRTIDSKAERALAEDSWNVLYHASLELVWYVQNEALWVIDLRTEQLAPLRIARGITGEMGDFKVEHPNGSASDNTLCDVEFFTLHFGQPPRFGAVAEGLAPPVLENEEWLVAQLGRKARALPESPRFSPDKKRRIAKRARACEAYPEECGATLPLGARGTELVVMGNAQGDCFHRYCLLYDPTTKLYSTPPDGKSWSAPAALEPSECEVYRFATDDLTFFTYTQLCVPGAPCVDVAGTVLGWLVPGRVVGDP